MNKKAYYRAPSCARLINELRLERSTAIKIRRIIHGTLDPAAVSETQKWIDQCYHRPHDIELRMHAINALLEMHGCEAIPHHFCGAYPDAEYCNAGDTYGMTIVFCYRTDQFFLTSWGDYVERAERRGIRYE